MNIFRLKLCIILSLNWHLWLARLFLSSVQWSLFNHFILESEQMLPPYSFPFQSYYFVPNIASQFNPMIYQNNGPYYVQSFFPQMGFSASVSTQNPSLQPTNANSLEKQTNQHRIASNNFKGGDSVKISNNIFKEKLIKKPVNRPATYLTQRKFYLAQQLPEEENSQRKLRPRKIKKRSHKTITNISHAQQNNDHPPLDEPQPAQNIKSPKQPGVACQKQKVSNCESSKGDERETLLLQGTLQMREGVQSITTINQKVQQ